MGILLNGMEESQYIGGKVSEPNKIWLFRTMKKKQKIIWNGEKWYSVDEDKWWEEFYKIQKDLEKQAIKDLYAE